MAVMGKVGTTGVWGGAKVTMGRLNEAQVWDLVRDPLIRRLTVRDTSDLRFVPPWMIFMTDPSTPDYIWKSGTPSQTLGATARRACRTLAERDMPVFTLNYVTAVAPNNVDDLVNAVIEAEPELVDRRKEVETAEWHFSIDVEEAHSLFQRIVNRQAAGSYGEKLMSLVAANYVVIEAPHRRVNSFWEKGAKSSDQRRFGLSRKISGPIPDRFPTKLVVHTHNSYTGGVLSASIKDLIGEDTPGGNRMIEDRYAQTFSHESYDTWMKALKLSD